MPPSDQKREPKGGGWFVRGGFTYYLQGYCCTRLLHLLSAMSLSQLALLSWLTYLTPCKRYSVTAGRVITPAD